MNRRKAEEGLRVLLGALSGKDTSRLGRNDDLVRELGLDSLAGLRLLAEVEKRFDVCFPDERLGEFRTLGQLLEVIVGTEEKS